MTEQSPNTSTIVGSKCRDGYHTATDRDNERFPTMMHGETLESEHVRVPVAKRAVGRLPTPAPKDKWGNAYLMSAPLWRRV